MKLTSLCISSAKLTSPVRIALAADLHSADPAPALEKLYGIKPDVTVVAGDLFDSPGDDPQNALAFLRGAASVSRVIYTMGNHECGGGKWIEDLDIPSTGAVCLENDSLRVGEIVFGGYRDASGGDAFALDFARQPGFKALICHRPERYGRYLRGLDIDLILSGHAHGGQIGFFGRGLYAPGQGLFPKYVRGIYDGRLVVSRGLTNSVPVPRLFNPTELICLDLIPKNARKSDL